MKNIGFSIFWRNATLFEGDSKMTFTQPLFLRHASSVTQSIILYRLVSHQCLGPAAIGPGVVYAAWKFSLKRRNETQINLPTRRFAQFF